MTVAAAGTSATAMSSTAPVTPIATLQGPMTSAVQAALLALQASLSSSLEQRLEASLWQQDQRIDGLIGNLQSSISDQGQANCTSTSINNYTTMTSAPATRLPYRW